MRGSGWKARASTNYWRKNSRNFKEFIDSNARTNEAVYITFMNGIKQAAQRKTF
jgi:hypothetical protein